MNRRNFIHDTALTAAGLIFAPSPGLGTESGSGKAFPVVRVPEAQRRFKSAAVEKIITHVQTSIGNKELAWMFGNCFPNTLDTTVDFEIVNGKPDTYVITGDIDAMWLRDSSAQVWPYLPFMKEDIRLQELIAGVIHRQTRCILLDPYANAFYKDSMRSSPWKTDLTEMKAGVHERKWELDSLCYPIRLAHGYWKVSKDISPFDASWREAVLLTLKTFREQQRKNEPGPYRFQRRTTTPVDTQVLGGYGNPARPVGLIFSMFRPSDDATVFPFLVPSNFFALISLRQAAEMLDQIHQDHKLAAECSALADEVEQALRQYAIVQLPEVGSGYAYEVDTYGSRNCMDDANVPDLLSLPYLGAVEDNDPLYQTTRRWVLSARNPYYFKGRAAQGLGGPHTGLNMIWPLSLIMQAMTSRDNSEIHYCLDTLRRTHAGTGFMHEAFESNHANQFTRSWFAWANAMFGELILKVYGERRTLLD